MPALSVSERQADQLLDSLRERQQPGTVGQLWMAQIIDHWGAAQRRAGRWPENPEGRGGRLADLGNDVNKQAKSAPVYLAPVAEA